MNMTVIIFASWMSFVTEPLVNDIADIMNSQVTAKNVKYEGSVIAFQHQMWRIRESSVCSDHARQTPNYSKCTVKAKRLFKEMCDYLVTNKTSDRSHRSYQQMYCNAAVSYKPTIISISKGDDAEVTEQEKQRIECNLLTIRAMGNSDKRLIDERNRVCGR
jgi:hypothetical protein